MAYFSGIDIGSQTSKGVITKDGELLAYHLLPSGINYGETAQRLREELLSKAGLTAEGLSGTVTTGHVTGITLYDSRHVTDILCCARGINNVFPSARTIIDVQAQSSQVIRINEKGKVINFAVSEVCASGSGCFLEIIANVLQAALKDIGPLSLKSKNPVNFTTGCAVFGESEAISMVSEGILKEDILAGVHKALASKLSALMDRVGLEEPCAISGGGGLNTGLIKSLEDLKIKLLVPSHPHLINALGAALTAQEIPGIK